MIARQTARKVRAWDLMTGTFVKKEGFEPSFIKTQAGEEISRARILGTVVAKFKSEDGSYASVTIDDGSDTVRLKAFKETDVVDALEIGDVVDVVGKVREYNGENYIMPEFARKVLDPNFELLRRLELMQKERNLKKSGPAKLEKSASKEAKKKVLTGEPAREDNAEVSLGERAELKKHVLKMIGEKKDGIVYSELVSKVKAKEADLESVIDELLNEGICYEPSPGKIRKI